jgi:hypothetical protein
LSNNFSGLVYLYLFAGGGRFRLASSAKKLSLNGDDLLKKAKEFAKEED